MCIKSLGYIGIDTTALQDWRDLASTVLGFETVNPAGPAGSDDVLMFRMDSSHHRISIYPGSRNGLRYLGWQVDDRAALQESIQKLKSRGVGVEHAPRALAAERAVRELVCFSDPEGFRHELFYGQLVAEAPFRPSRALTGYVTGTQGMGHVVLCAAQREALVAFFQETFGFRLSDTITLHGVEITFLRCNPRHHSLAIMEPGLGVNAAEMHHVMFELQALDDVGSAYDLVQEKKVPLILSLGRHVNDHMVSFYFKSPSGVGIEIGCGGRTVDEAHWVPAHYNYAGIWGHKLVLG